MEKYKGKYRIASARWAAWDYGSNAAYFITICTKTRSHDFGEIVNGEMQLTPLGQSAWDCWFAIPDHFPFVILGAFVAMPNHVHGIIIIAKTADDIAATIDDAGVETQNLASLQSPPPKNKFGPQSKNLASIVRGYKIGVTKFSRRDTKSCVSGTDIDAKSCVSTFTWQPRYHDHVIRNDEEYQRIEQYIHNNPQNWADDKFYAP